MSGENDQKVTAVSRQRTEVSGAGSLNVDEVDLAIDGYALIRLVRKTTLDVPHEVTIVIPRAEFREKEYKNGQLTSEKEVILSSITVVHAPRHPLAGENAGERQEPIRLKFRYNNKN